MSDEATFGTNIGHTDSTQPRPVPGGRSVTNAVIHDLTHRRAYGMKKYGQELLSNDGRDHLVDAYQEALDLVMYLKQELLDREQPPRSQCYVMPDGTCISPFACDHGDGLPLDEFVNAIIDYDRQARRRTPGDPLVRPSRTT